MACTGSCCRSARMWILLFECYAVAVTVVTVLIVAVTMWCMTRDTIGDGTDVDVDDHGDTW